MSWSIEFDEPMELANGNRNPAVAAQTSGLAGILASGQAPAFAQGTTVHWLR